VAKNSDGTPEPTAAPTDARRITMDKEILPISSISPVTIKLYLMREGGHTAVVKPRPSITERLNPKKMDCLMNEYSDPPKIGNVIAVSIRGSDTGGLSVINAE
jgi:hypothetical protein